MEQWTLWTGLALQRTRHQPKIYDAFEKIGDSRRTYPDTLPVHVRTNDNTMNKSTRRKVKKYPKKKNKNHLARYQHGIFKYNLWEINKIWISNMPIKI